MAMKKVWLDAWIVVTGATVTKDPAGCLVCHPNGRWGQWQ